jgi:hypothetical protein
MPNAARHFFDSLRTSADIAALVGESENLYFEAKTCATPFSDTDKGKLAKSLSGFANADGGVLIYGLVAKGGSRDTPDVVTTPSPVQDVALLESRILSLIGQLAQPPIENVLVEVRRLSDDPNSGFVLIFIPASDQAPHRCRKSHEYYRRHGSTTLPMEHDEIADMFGRRRRPQLRIFYEVKPDLPREPIPELLVIIGLENVGSGTAKFPAVRLNNVRAYHYGIGGKWGLPPRPLPNNRDLLYGGGADDVIHPGAQLHVTIIKHYLRHDPKQTILGYPDLNVEYEIHAEDMMPVRATLHVDGDELLKRVTELRSLGT